MADLYGCNNRPRPVEGAPSMVPDGYYSMPPVPDGNTCLSLRYIAIPYRMSTDCKYDKSASDAGCSGCAHAPHLHQEASA